MEIITITREVIKAHPHHNSGIFEDKTRMIRCGLCMPPRSKHESRQEYLRTVKHHVLRIDSQAVKVTFRNKTVAYYGLACWNKPENAQRVQSILSRELKQKIEPIQTIS